MVLRHLARPLLASWFVYNGVTTFLSPEERAAKIAPEVEPALADFGVPDVSATDVVKAHAAITVGTAASLALSRTPRTAALALFLLNAGVLPLEEPFWKETDEVRRREGMENFLKGAALLGGVLLAASAGHSSRHNAKVKAKKAKAKTKKQAKAAEAKLAKAQDDASAKLRKLFR